MSRMKNRFLKYLKSCVLGFFIFGGIVLIWSFGGYAGAQASEGSETSWVEEIEKVFVSSEQCKQCHDRHYEEWKGMREQTPDLKTFGRVDGALLHGTALQSHVFKTVLGVWLQTNPSESQRTECLSCHAPAVTVFPQHTDRIIGQVIAGGKNVTIEGIGCSACHLIDDIQENPKAHPTFKINPGKTLFGPYANAEDNLVHTSTQASIFREAKYCAACHFSKVKDVTRADLPGEILKGTICQDCHMERSTGSSTSKRGSLTRPIGRHWFQGIVIPGIMLSNRNLQAEWFPRVDIEAEKNQEGVSGKVLIRNGSLPHMFPGGDPVLKQFFVDITIKDEHGKIIGTQHERFGRNFEELLRGAIPSPLVNGGMTRRVPFSVAVPDDTTSLLIEASLSYALIPEPSTDLMNRYLDTLSNDKERQAAKKVIKDYTSTRLLTFRTMNL